MKSRNIALFMEECCENEDYVAHLNFI